MMSLLRSYYDVAPTELFGCRSSGAIGMSLLWSYWDVAPLELLGCRSYGAIMMSLLRSYYQGTAPEVRYHNKH
jgi:Cys-tRNA synthase (O-phospho-L-seryl-tRNA:Cys-tRNA synthase)